MVPVFRRSKLVFDHLNSSKVVTRRRLLAALSNLSVDVCILVCICPLLLPIYLYMCVFWHVSALPFSTYLLQCVSVWLSLSLSLSLFVYLSVSLSLYDNFLCHETSESEVRWAFLRRFCSCFSALTVGLVSWFVF